jgi:acetolactate synthase-1/2/3 large subunit
MARGKASDVFVTCLEAEGVEYVFGIPGEETVDLNRSLAESSIRFVPVRHEQGGGYMADMYGRLTQRPGVCLGTLGPGATNLVTPVADAFLDHAPLVALTGQADLERMHKESHQFVDTVPLFRPITKWNTRLQSSAIVTEAVRKAFRVARAQKPGPTHLELPEDVMAADLDARPLPARSQVRRPMPSEQELEDAAGLIRESSRPIVLAGNGLVRVGASPALREFSRVTGIPVAETFMGKGLLDYEDERFVGTVGLQARDYAIAGFEEADLVITAGFDLVEHAPRHWNPHADKRIVCIDTAAPEVDVSFTTELDLIGDMTSILLWLAEHLPGVRTEPPSRHLNDIVMSYFEAARGDDAFPVQPPRALWEIRQALGPSDMVVSDVGLHKLWIARMFPAHEPNTVMIANGLAGMGNAVPSAIAAKLVDPKRRVVTVNGDGGFLMNVQELETARRLGVAVVNVVWEDAQFGSIVWKQERKFGRSFGVDFDNPDFVALGESFGLPAWRCQSIDDFTAHLRRALELDRSSVIVLPIDYSLDVAISEQLGMETVAT